MEERLQHQQQLQDAAFGVQTQHEAAVDETAALYNTVMASYTAAQHHRVGPLPLPLGPLGSGPLTSVRLRLPPGVRWCAEQQRAASKTRRREALQRRAEASAGGDRRQPAAPSGRR